MKKQIGNSDRVTSDRVTSIVLLILVVGVLSGAVGAFAEETTGWSVIRKQSYLLKELPKKQKTKKIMLSASDFDSRYLFPCKSTELDELEERGESADADEMLPRVLLVNAEKTQVWVCATEDSVIKVGAGRFRMRENFRIFLRPEGGRTRLIADDGEVVARPYELRIEGPSVRLVKNLATANAKQSPLPLSSRDLICENKSCYFTKEKCAMVSMQASPTAVLQGFDRAVAKYKKSPTTAIESSKPFEYLDRLLVLAVMGDSKAKRRLSYFPIDVSGNVAGLEILTSYLASFKEARLLGCGKVTQARSQTPEGVPTGSTSEAPPQI